MAEKCGARSSSARPRHSHSPNSAHSPTIPRTSHHTRPRSLHSESTNSSCNLFRWVIRIMMYTCLSSCSIIITLNHDSVYIKDRVIMAEAILYDVVILIAMSKTWHRKRMPGYLFWLLAFIFLRSTYCIIEAGISWSRR